MAYNENDLVVCKVINIVGTTVFIETMEGIKGSIVVSEIAPGRIRNLRDYVVPNKIIVCKILSIKDGHFFLSLRRVKEKERKELMEIYSKSKTYSSIIRKILGGKRSNIIEKIESKYKLIDFVNLAKENPKILEEYFEKEEIKQLEKVLQEKDKKNKEIKREFMLKCKEPNGIIIIKKMLKGYEGITYLGSSKFSVKRTSNDLKKLDSEITNMFENLEKVAKKEKCDFQVLRN